MRAIAQFVDDGLKGLAIITVTKCKILVVARVRAAMRHLVARPSLQAGLTC